MLCYKKECSFQLNQRGKSLLHCSTCYRVFASQAELCLLVVIVVFFVFFCCCYCEVVIVAAAVAVAASLQLSFTLCLLPLLALKFFPFSQPLPFMRSSLRFTLASSVVAHLRQRQRLLLPLLLYLFSSLALFMLLVVAAVGQNFICRFVRFSWLLNIICNSSRDAL